MRRSLVLICLFSLFLFAGCQKGPAEAALKASEEAVSGVQTEAEKYVPEQYASLKESVDAARAKFEEGDYAAVLTAGQEIPAKAAEVAQAAAAEKDKLTAAWNDLSGNLPGVVESVKAKIEELSKARRLPKGIDKAAVEAAKTGVTEVESAWAEASSAYSNGEFAQALEKGNSVKTKLEEIKASLGI